MQPAETACKQRVKPLRTKIVESIYCLSCLGTYCPHISRLTGSQNTTKNMTMNKSKLAKWQANPITPVPARFVAAGSLTDEKEGFPRLRARYHAMSLPTLAKEYRTGMKHCFHTVFGHNACRDQNVIAETLIARGITHLPDCFGFLKISKNWK